MAKLFTGLFRSPMGRLVLALTAEMVWLGPHGPVPLPPGQTLDLSAAFDAQARHTAHLFRLDGVVGTAVGIRADGLPVVKVYVAHGGVQGIPASFAGVPVDVEVTGEVHALGQVPDTRDCPGEGCDVALDAAEDATIDPRGRFPRPVPIGVSTGQPDVTAGTIGARATNGTKLYALSNNHVYAASNRARIGDHVLQPGVADGGTDPASAIGALADFEPIRFCTSFPRTCPENRIDAAIATTSSDDLGTSTPENGYGAPRSTTAKAELNLPVQKYGRTTGWTKGKITGLNATIDVNYRGGVARFVGQIVVGGGGFSTGGDSGSLIVTDQGGNRDRRPVALLFAGSNTTTIANPIDLVLDRFDITIDGR